MFKTDKTICSVQDCNNPRDCSYPKCKECRNKLRIERESKRVNLGLCFRCGKRPIQKTDSSPPSKSCLECNERNAKIRSGLIVTTKKIRGTLCKICGNSRDNKSSWCNACLRQYRKNLMSTRQCYDCRNPLENFNEKRCSDCNFKRSEKNRLKRKENKLKLIEHLGNQCLDCGLKELHYIDIYDFHHTNAELKEIEVAKLLDKDWSYVLKEVEKGVALLCANCHRIRHQKERE